MRRWTIEVALLTLTGGLGCGPTALQVRRDPPPAVSLPPGARAGIDRPGADYRDFDLERADALLCRDACVADTPCKAWTYVKPGVQGSAARCWLKSDVPADVPNDCCVSGVRTESGSTVER